MIESGQHLQPTEKIMKYTIPKPKRQAFHERKDMHVKGGTLIMVPDEKELFDAAKMAKGVEDFIRMVKELGYLVCRIRDDKITVFSAEQPAPRKAA